jgi:hypothetical protein
LVSNPIDLIDQWKTTIQNQRSRPVRADEVQSNRAFVADTLSKARQALGVPNAQLRGPLLIETE